MNPLTIVKRIQKITSTEAALGISEGASWHAKYKESAYIFVGGIPFELTEGDLLAVFAQYGEIVDVNLVRDKGTGKPKGFAFLAYEDQRSTILAVDNLNGAKVLGRIVRVDHVVNYKKKEEEDEEKEQQKREERGVCHAFQRGDCNRGAACKFSHNEQRNMNTGWGHKDSDARWGHDKYDGPSKSQRIAVHSSSSDGIKESGRHMILKPRLTDKDEKWSREEHEEREMKNLARQHEPHSRDQDRHLSDKRSRHASDSDKDGNCPGQHKPHPREDRDRHGGDKWSRHESDSSYRHRREDERHSDRARK